jgi:hypothetical protein
MGSARYRDHAHTLKSNLCGVFTSVVDPVSVVPVAGLVLAAVDFDYTGPSSAATWTTSVSVDINSFGLKTYRVCRNIPGSWEHGGHGFCTHLHIGQSFVIHGHILG